jgi:hypothetical protein
LEDAYPGERTSSYAVIGSGVWPCSKFGKYYVEYLDIKFTILSETCSILSPYAVASQMA